MTQMISLAVLPLLIPVPILAAATAIDLRSQRIPNYLTLPSILIALILHSAVSGVDGFLFSLWGAVAGIALLFLPYMMGGMGAGDAKLMGAVGAFVGAKGVFLAFLLTAIAGGLYALWVLIQRRIRFAGLLKRRTERDAAGGQPARPRSEAAPGRTNRPRLCYGLAISLGSLAYLALTISGYPFPI